MSALSSNSHHAQAIRCVSPDRTPTANDNGFPRRRSSVSFDDGNIAVLAGDYYFIVHRGLLCRHSEYFSGLIDKLDASNAETCTNLDGRPVLRLADSAEDLSLLFHALYDGLNSLLQRQTNLRIAFVLLRLSAVYQFENLHHEALEIMLKAWPSTLAHWNRRERHIPHWDSPLARDILLPHPIAVINLARQVGATELLPAAFYDLSRHLPSSATAGFVDPHDSFHHSLPQDDLVRLLRGREASSRFFSTFIVNELEGRKPSELCLNRAHEDPDRRLDCQGAFEYVTFELLRDVNGVVIGRTSDPLFAMLYAYDMQGKLADARTCDICRGEFGTVVTFARDRFWRQLPDWFGVDLSVWG
ncbi:hypothetical protein BV25DRAFT_1905815 [Artomyces pyxidatus]|uniref:Uncharacterized protein n=1 Tax=Artomyces pyxidatus TaxID=48021 RepID=A0ACB8TCM4_9AGAM|nr:hypothetical protein BV25DRAFT_1905815 [Artomyces pyxidatus]